LFSSSQTWRHKKNKKKESHKTVECRMGKSETLTGTGDFKDKDKEKDREKDKDKIKDNFKEMDREMRLLCISNPRGYCFFFLFEIFLLLLNSQNIHDFVCFFL